MNFEQEILKAQLSQEFNINRQIAGTDEHDFLKSMYDNLYSCYDKEGFEKSWSSDLAKRFPNGGWRTVNGSRVFINGGKVVAGLGGFNGMIDDYFSAKGKEEKKDNRRTELNENERLVLKKYNEDKKEFFKQNIRKDMRLELQKDSVDKMLSGINHPEYNAMLQEVKKEIERKIEEPKLVQKDIEEKEKGLKKFLKEGSDDIDTNKLLQGDVVENFKQLKQYERAVKDSRKAGLHGIAKHTLYLDRDIDNNLDNKVAEITPKEVNVKQTDTKSALKNIVGKDDLRPQTKGIYNDPDGYVVATDGTKLISVKTEIKESDKGKTIDPKTGEDVSNKLGEFPNYRGVINNYTERKGATETEFSLSKLHSYTNEASKLNKEHPNTLMEINGLSQKFNAEIFNDTVESLRKLGVEKVTINHLPEKEGQGILIKGKNNKGEEVIAVIMPRTDNKTEWDKDKRDWVTVGKIPSFKLKQK